MARPTCELCDRPATVHETFAGPGGPLERHYCTAHGGPIWSAALPDGPETRPAPGTFPDRFNHLRGQRPRGR
jgi:hypothetical protein